jgi:copper homeostasis protein
MDLEICVDSVESAIAAAKGGAERIELCSALSEGGITPSAGLISAVRAAVRIDVFVIIRPRGGDFVYSEYELEVMRKDIIEVKARGADGVVLGVLTAECTVDRARTQSLVELSRPMQVTFHRAFDECEDIDRALEDVIACGIDRLLTSGGKADAIRGLDQVARLQQRAAGRIGIMAGGGIRATNVRKLVAHTSVNAVHTSLSPGGTKVANHEVGLEDCECGSAPFVVTEKDVRAFKAELETIALEMKPHAHVQ